MIPVLLLESFALISLYYYICILNSFKFSSLCLHAKNSQTILLYLLASREVKAMQRPLDKFGQGNEFYSV